ncbi:MAG: hypothetical protein ABSB09_14670 [Acidimicrobiales bacterium]|jgi:hypothetical protein
MVTTPETAPSGNAGPPDEAGPSEGAGTPGDGGSGPVYEPMSLRVPVLIVLGLAVVILVGGVVASAVSSGSNPVFTLRQVTLSDGTVVALSPAAVKMKAIESNDEPPADILGNLGVPTASSATGVVNSDQNAAQFDRTVDFDSPLAPTQVIGAYTLMLKDVGWKILYSGPASQSAVGTNEVLAQKGSGDGFYWETGVVVSPATSAGTTPYSVEVYETPDGN